MMRRISSGQSLVEAVIAVALSGVFVLLLSGMLSQTLLLSTSSQNDLIAAHAAEELLENARVMTFTEIQQQINNQNISDGVPIIFAVNADGSTPFPLIRPVPVQLSLIDPSTAYGEINPSSTTILNTGTKWAPGFGNYFRGSATETVKLTSLNNNIMAYQVLVELAYNTPYAVTGGTQNTKKVSRTIYVMQGGLNFR